MWSDVKNFFLTNCILDNFSKCCKKITLINLEGVFYELALSLEISISPGGYQNRTLKNCHLDAFAFQGISNVTDITNFIPLLRFRCAQSYQFCDFCSVNEDTIFKKIRTGKSTMHCHFLRRSKILRRPRSGRQAANCALPRVTGEYGGSWA